MFTNFNSIPWPLWRKLGLKFGFAVVYFSIIYMTTITAQSQVILAILGLKIFFIKNPPKDMI